MSSSDSSSLAFHLERLPFAFVEWDAEFRVARWSPMSERIFGWKSQELLGKRFDEFEFVHPGDVEPVGRVVAHLMEGPTTNFCRNRNLTRSGGVIHCEWHNSSMADETGKVVSIFSVVMDVTARQAEESHRLSGLHSFGDYRFQELAESLPQMVFVIDPEGKALYRNRRWGEFTGRDGDLGRYMDLVHPEDAQRVLDAWNLHGRSDREFSFQFRMKGKDQPFRWFLCRLVPQRDENGKLVFWVGTHTDIQQQHALADELQVKEERLAQTLEAAAVATFEFDLDDPVETTFQTTTGSSGGSLRPRRVDPGGTWAG
jgi:PAS domain S-box-containing protein